MSGTDWSGLVRLSSQHLVTCHVGHVLLTRCGDSLPSEAHQYFSFLVARNRARNRRALEQMLEIIARFNALGVHSCVLKGMGYLVDGLYPDTAARIVSDIDILVDPGDEQQSAEVMRELGYEPSDESGFYRSNPDHHHGPPWMHPEREVAVEIHRRVLAEPFDRLIDHARAFENSRAIESNGISVRVMDPSYQMIHLIAHAQLMNRYWEQDLFELRTLLDAHLLHGTHGTHCDWALIRDTFQASLYEYAFNVFVLALNGTLGNPIPAPCRIRAKDRWCWLRTRSRYQRPRLWKTIKYLERAPSLPGRLLTPGWYLDKWRFLKLPRSERQRILYGGGSKIGRRENAD